MGGKCCCEEAPLGEKHMVKVANAEDDGSSLTQDERAVNIVSIEQKDDILKAAVSPGDGENGMKAKQVMNFNQEDEGYYKDIPLPNEESKVKSDASLAPAQPIPDGAFLVEIEKPSDNGPLSKLGLVLYCTESTGRKLKVKSVRPGLVSDYNSRNPTSPQVVPDITVLSVNGITDPKGCADEMAKAGKVALVMMKED
mmetsp:Transcript_63993/g.152594  ORF Transcript_63993/g.152594 Transcript_63993/m.152594 type:complete len:197 (-) Transcript_63993:148-738(-)|eukprot:CAMPEP_0178414616 /NCGR_PEP_ID=MMETSP0689_2-20121128/23127_1 /TAXON_ID=160604 /ORGANISM="Amphidinium massartii, Strain CS-259" /LENGTH=196 /DNA_ID=CAMNT_0020035909 /DNA_START=155 /DNA_END=745 /DNA_ORIENTATION=+